MKPFHSPIFSNCHFQLPASSFHLQLSLLTPTSNSHFQLPLQTLTSNPHTSNFESPNMASSGLYDPNLFANDDPGDQGLTLETQIDANEAPQAPEPTFILPTPPDGQAFHTEKEALDAIKELALLHGYAVSTLRTNRSKKGIKNKIQLCCTRGRQYLQRCSSTHVQQTTPQAINCPFSLLLRLNTDAGTWHLEVRNNAHNHPPAFAPKNAVAPKKTVAAASKKEAKFDRRGSASGVSGPE